MRISPDGVRYVTMGTGTRVNVPYHLRWLPSFVCRNITWRWRLYGVIVVLAVPTLTALWLHGLGLGWQHCVAGAAIVAVTQPLMGFWLSYPILTDGASQALALGAGCCAQQSWWIPAALLAVAAAATNEKAPFLVMLLVWSPSGLILGCLGLVAVGARLLVRPGEPLEADRMVLGRTWPSETLWGDLSTARWMLLPWGVMLTFAWAPTWPAAAAFAFGWVSVLAVATVGNPAAMRNGFTPYGEWDTARVTMYAFVPVLGAALFVIPVEWLIPAVLVQATNPWGRNPLWMPRPQENQ